MTWAFTVGWVAIYAALYAANPAAAQEVAGVWVAVAVLLWARLSLTEILHHRSTHAQHRRHPTPPRD